MDKPKVTINSPHAAKLAKGCPLCEKEKKNSSYACGWIIALCIVIILGAIDTNINAISQKEPLNSQLNNINTTTLQQSDTNNDTAVVNMEPADTIKTPLVVTVDDLYEALDTDALNACKTYKDAYVKLTGKLSVIDLDGKYISLDIHRSDIFSLKDVHCEINEDLLDSVINLEIDEDVTVTGTITQVGEILGYYLKVESVTQ